MKSHDLKSAIPPEILEAVADLPAVVPVGQAADFLNVTERTLRRWASVGKIRVLRTAPKGSGGKVSVLRSEVARVLAGMVDPVPFQR